MYPKRMYRTRIYMPARGAESSGFRREQAAGGIEALSLVEVASSESSFLGKVASGNPAILFRRLLHFRHLAPGRFGKDEAGKAGEAGGQHDLSEAASGLEQGQGTVFGF
jgi:hypothetical protein